MSNVKKYFAGANTSLGFHNLFDFIRLDQDGFHYILKGGAGTGKSTLMKTIATHFINKGEDIELFYCSSDSSSLDGLNLINHNITIVDGTSPHIVSDFLPSIEDKIINLGEHISPNIINHKKLIKNLSSLKKDYYNSAYAKLKIAGEIFNLKLNHQKIDNAQTASNELLKNLNATKLSEPKKVRELYLNILDFNNINLEKENNFNIISLNYNEKTNNEILTILTNKLSQLGYSLTLFKNILNPNLNTSLLINEKNILIKNENEIPNSKNDKIITRFLESAKKDFKMASSTHKKIEKIYHQYVNFDQITKLTNELISEIENRINKKY